MKEELNVGKCWTGDELAYLKNNASRIKSLFFPNNSKGTIHNHFSNKVLINIFNHYKYQKKDGREEDPKRIIISKKYFFNEEKYNKFHTQFIKAIKEDHENNDNRILINEEASKNIIMFFDNAIRFSEDNTEKTIYREPEEIKVNNKIESEKATNVENYKLRDGEYSVYPELTIDSIRDAISKNVDYDVKFKYNDSIEETKNFGDEQFDTVRKMRVRIMRKMDYEGALVLKYKTSCPICFKKFYYNDVQLNATEFGHLCDEKLSSKDLPMFVKFDKSSIKPHTVKQLYLYEIRFFQEEVEKTTHIYSLYNNLLPGMHDINIIKYYSKNSRTSYQMLIIANKKIQPKFSEELLAVEETKKWCAEKDIPFFKPLVPLFSARKFYKENFDIDISDKGMFLQIAIVTSLNARNVFKYRYLATSILGDSSISKTYTALLYSQLMDINFFYVPKGSSLSVPGLQGGVNVNKNIFGSKSVKMFESGVISKDAMVIFDEAQVFYDIKDRSNRLFNEVLKEFMNDETNISKIGGEENIPQRYTFVILSNFTDFHLEVYKDEVFKAYRNYLRGDEDYKKKHSAKDVLEITNYLGSINLFMPLEHYVFNLKNKHLAQAIAYVRKKFEEKDVDWKTGGRIPASNRILFDVVVDGRNMSEEVNPIPEVSNNFGGVKFSKMLPVEDFVKSHMDYFGFHQQINFNDMKSQPESIRKKMSFFKEKTKEFFEDDERGRDIIANLKSNRNGTVDDKIIVLLIDTITQWQLIQDKNSDKLNESTKTIAHWMFTKTKRGLTKEEYDFVDNDYRPLVKRSPDQTLSLDNLQAIYLEGKELLEEDKLLKVVKREKQEEEIKKIVEEFDDSMESEKIFIDEVDPIRSIGIDKLEDYYISEEFKDDD